MSHGLIFLTHYQCIHQTQHICETTASETVSGDAAVWFLLYYQKSLKPMQQKCSNRRDAVSYIYVVHRGLQLDQL